MSFDFDQKYDFKFDPLGKYTDMSVEDALWRIGVLSSFILQDYLEVTTAKEAFDSHFKHPITWQNVSENNNLTVTDDGIFRYTDDPDLYALACFKNTYETVYIFPSGWVYIDDGKEPIVARID